MVFKTPYAIPDDRTEITVSCKTQQVADSTRNGSSTSFCGTWDNTINPPQSTDNTWTDSSRILEQRILPDGLHDTANKNAYQYGECASG
jgi:hypothetical protein